MNVFKVGDEAVRLDDTLGKDFKVGEKGLVTEVLNGQPRVKGLLRSPSSLKVVKPEWQPEAGEMIEVTDYPDWPEKPIQREFFAMDGDEYVIRQSPMARSFCCYKKARKATPDTTITDAKGNKFELSLESYNKMFPS